MINYAVDGSSGEEDEEEDAVKPIRANRSRERASKRRKTSVESDDDDVFLEDAETDYGAVDEGKSSQTWPLNLILNANTTSSR